MSRTNAAPTRTAHARLEGELAWVRRDIAGLVFRSRVEVGEEKRGEKRVSTMS